MIRHKGGALIVLRKQLAGYLGRGILKSVVEDGDIGSLGQRERFSKPFTLSYRIALAAG